MVAPPATVDSTAVQSLGAQGQSAAALDTATAADLAAVKVSAPASAQILGSVTVGLGSPAVQGFWLSSNLVSAPQKGTVTTAAGKSLAVDLLPSTTGAQLSFSAYRALGLALTDLPVVQVSTLN